MSARVRGGVFGALEASAHPSPAPGSFAAALSGRGRCVATSHARGGLDLLVERLDPRRVWLPAFLCDALLTARVGPRARFYGLGEDLALDAEAIDALALGPDDLFVAIAFFGRAPERAVLERVRERGARVLVDASGALLTGGLEAAADYLLSSPRKFVGVPDGGLLVPVGDAPWFEPAALDAWSDVALALEAVRARAAFDARGGDGPEREWFASFSAAEEAAPDGPRAMHPRSREALARADWVAIAERRRANHRSLAKGIAADDDLRVRLLHPELGDDEVPLGAFAIFDEPGARDAARSALYAACIYAPLHWSLDGVVPSDFAREHDLASRCLTLVCDQRYDERDMRETIEVLGAAARGEVSS